MGRASLEVDGFKDALETCHLLRCSDYVKVLRSLTDLQQAFSSCLHQHPDRPARLEDIQGL